jgi:hypothetical protein
MYEDALFHEPTAAQVLHDKRVENPMPKTIMLSGTSASVSGASATLSVQVALSSVAPGVGRASAVLSVAT